MSTEINANYNVDNTSTNDVTISKGHEVMSANNIHIIENANEVNAYDSCVKQVVHATNNEAIAVKAIEDATTVKIPITLDTENIPSIRVQHGNDDSMKADNAVNLATTCTQDNDVVMVDDAAFDITMPSSPNEGKATPKVHPIEEDVQQNLFIKTDDIPANKRRGKMGKLLEEDITFDVYAKKSGFLTKRPLQWAIALESFLDKEPDTNSRWQYKEVENIYTDCEVLIFFEVTKQVTVNISVQNGEVMVYGKHYKDWLTKSFAILKSIVTGTPIENALTKKVVATEDDDVRGELEKIWSECKSMKNGLVTLEESVQLLQKAQNEYIGLAVKQEKEYKKDLENIEKAFDDKLVTFLSTINSDTDNKIKMLKSEVLKDREQQHQAKSKLESKLHNLINSVEAEKKATIESPNNIDVPKWTELEAIKKNFNQTQQSILNDIDQLRTQLDGTDIQIKSLSILINSNNNIGDLKSRTGQIETKVDSLMSNSLPVPKELLENIEREIKGIQKDMSTMMAEQQKVGDAKSHFWK